MNVVILRTNSTQNPALFPHENYVPTASAPTAISLEVDTDDIDFAPTSDGELISGKQNSKDPFNIKVNTL